MNIEKVELLRKKAQKVALLGFLPFFLIVIICILFKAYFFIFPGFIISVVIDSLLSAGPTREFNLAFKQTFVLKALNSVFNDLVYEPEKGLNKEVIRYTGMMDMGDRYYSNDFISCKYKNINVIQADVHIEEERTTTDSDGNTSTTYVTIFRGRWMVFDFNKSFKANVQICQKGFTNSRRYSRSSDLRYEKVLMEDQEFNNNFRVYAQNEHDAFYILTPALMEKIKKLVSNISGSLLFCFVDNKLHIGIENGKDSFEHNIFTKIDEEKVTNDISQDIKLITDFVDELDLDNDLFRREV